MSLRQITALENRKNEIVERLAQLDQLIDVSRPDPWGPRVNPQEVQRRAALVSESRRITQESARITAELRRLHTRPRSRSRGGGKTRRYKKRNKN